MTPSIAGLKPRPRPAEFSGRHAFPLPERLQRMSNGAKAEIGAPFVGITTDGSARPGLFSVHPTGVSTRGIAERANALLEALQPEQRSSICYGVDSDAWRSWNNISVFLMRHGLLLEDVSERIRGLALDLVAESLSRAGYETARNVMKLNEHIGELTGLWHEYGEWVYWLSIFGTPSESEPWGWQIDGHHLIVNCFVLGDQVVLTPQFMGSEPVLAESGKYAGTRVFEDEETIGYTFMSSLSPAQQQQATVGMQLPFDVLSTAPHDNLVLPYAGIRHADLAPEQQQLLSQLFQVYFRRLPPGHAEQKFEEVRKHLDETFFAWIGAVADHEPFYYRVHSPVVLIEFDHQPGIALDNDQPSRNHTHTLIRTPNGNDYGRDLLRQHYAEAPHHQRGA